jgi:AcrR family transcriptional regulator
LYCGSNKTALASQEQIADAFVSLLREKPYNSISICQICRKAGISRQTFYSLFASKENIVAYELERRHGFTPGITCSGNEMTLEQLCREYSCYIREKRDFLELLAQNGIFYQLHDCLYQSFMNCSCFLSSQSEERRAYASEFIAGGLSGAARIYIEKGQQDGGSSLEETLILLFSGKFLDT